MAGHSDKMIQVFFIGAWRTQQVSDQLLRQISNQIALKKKIPTQLTISSEGLELLILNSEGRVTRKDKIALENVVDFINNKFSTTCTLAIVREKQQKAYTVFVFLCKSDRDTAALIHNFKATKKQLSGEGYNTNLTPKGKNWTLQQKSETSVHKVLNGDVRGHTVVQVPGNDVRIINTEKQNGGVTVIDTTDRHDSFSRESVRTSNSEVKEELHQLADEVRGIKKLLQGSKGRSQFEKHYGYRIAQRAVPENREVEYTERNISMRSPEPIPGHVYVKNEANVRYANGGPQVVRIGGGVARSTRRFKSSKGHYVTATSPTRVDYTKRVYDSKNPYAEAVPKIQPVRVVTRRTQPMVVPRQRLYKPMSQSSDIVHKNIEDVYKSRSLRRIYLPPSSPNGKTVEYVNSQMVHAQREPLQIQTNTPSVKGTEQTAVHAVHINHNPEVRTYYETNDYGTAAVKSSSSNVSTNIDTSLNDNLEVKVRQIDNNLDIEPREYEYKRDDNVIVVKTIPEVSQSYSENIDNNVVYVQKENSRQPVESNTIGGGVYHVRAEFREDYEKKTLANDEHVTVIESTVANPDDVRIIEPSYEISDVEVKTTTVGNPEDVRIIEPSYEISNVDVKTTTVGNPEDVRIIEPSYEISNDEVKTTAEVGDNENIGLFGAYTEKPDEHDEPRNEIITEKVYRYTEGDVNATAESGQEENIGLFGAYAKKPEDHNEPRDVIITETAYRYHDNDDKLVIVENKTESLQSMKEDGGLFGAYAKEPEEYNETKTEIIKVLSNQYDDKEIDKVEENAETIFEAGKQEISEEKHVRYNEMVEQIPLVSNDQEYNVENIRHEVDVYEVDNQGGEASKDEFKHELGSVVSRMKHNYERKSSEESNTDQTNTEDEEEYKVDMDALRAFSMEPDIVIVEADNDKDAENVLVINRQSVNEEIEFGKDVLNEGDDDVEISYSAKSAEIQIEPEKSNITEENISEVISRTEDTVLF